MIINSNFLINRGKYPMLSDLLLLEMYYGSGSAALFFEDVSLRYGAPVLQKALRAGELATRQVLLGPDAGRWLITLTDKGRTGAGIARP
jgi:hypothetical protein